MTQGIRKRKLRRKPAQNPHKISKNGLQWRMKLCYNRGCDIGRSSVLLLKYERLAN